MLADECRVECLVPEVPPQFVDLRSELEAPVGRRVLDGQWGADILRIILLSILCDLLPESGAIS